MRPALSPLLVLVVTGPVLVGAAGPSGCSPGPRPLALHRFWPRFSRPATVLTVKPVASQEDGILTQTLGGGLVAQEARLGRGREMLWFSIEHPAYKRWLAAMQKQTGARIKYQTATPRDDFILLGGGYFYPDLFGKSCPAQTSPELMRRAVCSRQEIINAALRQEKELRG